MFRLRDHPCERSQDCSSPVKVSPARNNVAREGVLGRPVRYTVYGSNVSYRHSREVDHVWATASIARLRRAVQSELARRQGHAVELL